MPQKKKQKKIPKPKNKTEKKEEQGVSIWFIVLLFVGVVGFVIFQFVIAGEENPLDYYRVIKPGMVQGEVKMYLKEPLKIITTKNPEEIKLFGGDKAPKRPLNGEVYIYMKYGYYGYIFFNKEGKVEEIIGSKK